MFFCCGGSDFAAVVLVLGSEPKLEHAREALPPNPNPGSSDKLHFYQTPSC